MIGRLPDDELDTNAWSRRNMKPSLILHPVSYSPTGRSALARALALARWYHADLHVLESRGGRPQDPIVRDFRSAGVEPHFSEFVESVGADGVRLSAVEIAGDDVAAVIDYAGQASADVVVVAGQAGSHSHQGPASYAENLARSLPCPTLAIRAAHDARLYEGAPFARILCATDLSSASAEAVRLASSLARETGARLALLHVQESGRYRSTSSMGQELRVDRPLPHVEVNRVESCEIDTIAAQGVVHEAIVETASRIGSDLIVIGRTEHGGTNRAGRSSRAAAVLRRASCPVLVVPAYRADWVLAAS